MTVGRILIKTYIFISLSWAFLKTGKKTRVSHRVKIMTRWPGRERWPKWPIDPVTQWPSSMSGPQYVLTFIYFRPALCFILVYNCGLTVRNKRICYVMLSFELHLRSSPIFVRLTHGCGSVLLWRRNMFRTFGFRDGVIFAHSQGCSTSPPSWSAVHTQPWAWLQNVRSNRLPVAGQRTHWTTFRALKVTSQVATQGGGVTALFQQALFVSAS